MLDLTPIIENAITVIDFIAVIIITWGCLVAAVSFIRSESRSLFKLDKVDPSESLRLNFGSKLVVSLEFFLAADIIRTVLSPDWNSVGLLAALIIIRTILSYVLTLELNQKHVH